ncbi:interleukin-5 receptor subunit alpha-like isoform X2 [Spea bombifrons]|uniref:interleukin-5 receptor subunit alpha-like isoform X2 n=1 Tax=Spea bombifrons TaxID=233779 RepID=UPI002349AEC9|nr:interleukin-5 receptor subunit alpha-like isoform X2 [Spea bombifrons]
MRDISAVSYLMCLLLIQVFCATTKSSQDAEFAPLPTDLKVTIGVGFLNVSWDCNNITTAMEQYEYKAVIFGRFTVLHLQKCFVEIIPEAILHKGVEVEIRTMKNGRDVKNNWTTKTIFPEGGPYTSDENISCVVFNISFMNCSWDVGRQAAENTTYLLYLIQEGEKLTCPAYEKDLLGRHNKCLFSFLDINFDKSVHMIVLEESKNRPVRFLDEFITPADYEILTPPRNFTLNNSLNRLVFTWLQPETLDPYAEDCFNYELNIWSKNNEATHKVKTTMYTIPIINVREQLIAKVRAKWVTPCFENTFWGEWSEPIFYRSPDSPIFTRDHLLIVLTVCTIAVLSVSTVLCCRFKILRKIFPPVPQPVNVIKDFGQYEQRDKQEHKFSAVDMVSVKDEECVCSTITEVQDSFYVNC